MEKYVAQMADSSYFQAGGGMGNGKWKWSSYE